MLAPVSVSRSPRHLASLVHAAIRAHLGRVAEKIRVDCNDGDVTLVGKTFSYYQRQLAIHAAQSAVRDGRIVDAIEVVYPRRRTG